MNQQHTFEAHLSAVPCFAGQQDHDPSTTNGQQVHFLFLFLLKQKIWKMRCSLSKRHRIERTVPVLVQPATLCKAMYDHGFQILPDLKLLMH